MATETTVTETGRVQRKRRYYLQQKNSRGEWEFFESALSFADAERIARHWRGQGEEGPFRVASEETVTTTTYTEVLT